MYDEDDKIGFLIVFIVLMIIVYGVHAYLKEKKRRQENSDNSSSK